MAKKNFSSILLETEQPTRKRRRKERKPVHTRARTVVSLLLFLAGIALMAAPLATNFLEYQDYNDAVSSIEQAVENTSAETHTGALDASYRYNESLAVGRTPEIEQYNELLNVAGDSVMGLLRLPKLDIVLPIYHSTTPVEDIHGVAQVGPDGASRGSSLPVGGPSTHALISNVNSLPSAKQFAAIQELENGDRINISMMGEELAYEIYESKMTTLEDAANIGIVQGEDHITLVLAQQGDDESRYVVRASRSQVASNLYLGDYDTDDPEDIFRIVFMNMSVPQGVLFVLGAAVVLFFLGRWMMQVNDRAPRELGRLTGDSG